MNQPADQVKKAVALEYDGASAPTVTAKGAGDLAEKIIQTAEEHGIHIDNSPMLVEALSDVELNEEIPVELYQAVAEIIGFVMRTKANA